MQHQRGVNACEYAGYVLASKINDIWTVVRSQCDEKVWNFLSPAITGKESGSGRTEDILLSVD